MSLKKLGVALLAVVVMGAIVANSAYAENEFKEMSAQFYTENPAGSGILVRVGTGETLDLIVSGGASTLTSRIATKPIKFSSTGVTGAGCSATNLSTTVATIDCEFLTFTGVTVSGEAAAACSTPGIVTTKALTGFIGMNKAGTLETIKITPKAGAGTTFALLELTGTCANAGTYKVTGTVFAQAASATGTFPKTQELSVSEAIQKLAGTATSLKFGENGAFINGGLNGTTTLPWGSKDK